MNLIAGVDGGQSSTTAVIASLDAGELARGYGPAADLVGETPGSPRQASAIAAAIGDALARAQLDAATPLAAIVVGLTGFEEGDAVPALPFPGARVRVVHDSLAAHAGALGGAPGIVTIAGTGSVVLGTDASGARERAGGWGFLFGDEGSAFAIGRAAVALAMRRSDRAESCACIELALGAFHVRRLREIQSGYASGAIGRPAIAALAAGVVELAESGDLDALSIVRFATQGLAESVHAVHERLVPTEVRAVSYAGGLFRSRTYVRAFTTAIEADDDLGAFRVVSPVGDGAAGAVTLAADLAFKGAPLP